MLSSANLFKSSVLRRMRTKSSYDHQFRMTFVNALYGTSPSVFVPSAPRIDRTVFAIVSWHGACLLFDFLDRSSTYIPLIFYIYFYRRDDLAHQYIYCKRSNIAVFCIFLSLYIDFLYDLSRLIDRFLKSKMYEFEPLRRYNLAPMAYT